MIFAANRTHQATKPGFKLSRAQNPKGLKINTAQSRHGFNISRWQTQGGFNADTRQAPKGFTLIELFVVISIILILIAVGTESLIRSSQIARNNKRRADLKTMQLALERYFTVFHQYPNTIGRSGCWVDWCGESSAYGSYTSDYIPGLAPMYIDKLPNDPKAGKDNLTLNTICTGALSGYVYRSDGKDYKIAAHCTIESAPVTAQDPLYDALPRSWDYALYTPGARNW